MSSSHPPFNLPLRVSLSVRAANAIRQAITDNTWKEYLPSERRLCEIFRVSRPTIRTALHLLAKEGLIAIHQGRRNRLLTTARHKSGSQSRLVGLIAPEPVSHLALVTYQGVSEMRAHLAEHGFTTEILVCPPGSAKVQQRRINEFVRQNRVFCCVLISVSKELQQWFSEHSIPALVVGSCHPQVKLPSLDVDYRSVCRHAAGILLGKGHRRLALVVPNSGVAGDLASEEGFSDAITRHHQHEARATIVRHNGTAANITAKLDALFNSAHAPTALLIAKPQHVIIVIIYLLKCGITVPDTVSLIARDHDHNFGIVSPPIAHYAFKEGAFVHRLSRLMLQMVNRGYLPLEPNLIFPKFFAGGTVRQLA
ncbi:MAG: GntR family transcriptional regulator [Opitutaceae bacterium]|jgi:DNA-binding LacI/PurR family transcriptional regulator|nr:GntR family transcriptional regulator [Opitutaceae bacterium]